MSQKEKSGRSSTKRSGSTTRSSRTTGSGSTTRSGSTTGSSSTKRSGSTTGSGSTTRRSSQNISSLLREPVLTLDTPLSAEEIMSHEIKPREVANVVLRNDTEGFMDMFLSEDSVRNAFKKIEEYNLKETLTHTFEFFIVKIKEDYFVIYLNEGIPSAISINTGKAESKFVVLFDKLDSLIKTSGFKICSGILSKDYLKYCLKESDYFVIALGMHKRHTKLKNRLSRDTPDKKLSNIISYDCLGFSFLERYKKAKDSIYLQAICSNKGFGDKILKITELMSEFMLFNKMYLSAVDTALAYYISRNYEIIINKKKGRNLKYIVDPYSSKYIKEPIKGSKELYGYRGSEMFRTVQKRSKKGNRNNTRDLSSVRRSSRTKKRVNESTYPKQFILQNVSFDDDDNINMVKEMKEFRETTE